MEIKNKADIIEILNMDYTLYENTIMRQARDILIKAKNNKVNVTGMVSFDNVCRNHCTYCGMNASNTSLKRYRMSIEEIFDSIKRVKELDLKNIFFISGEDPKFGFQNLINIVKFSKELELFVMMAVGELSNEEFYKLKEAGLDEYALKFETSNNELFSKIKPKINYNNRLKAIYNIKKAGLLLGSGNIVGFPGQSIEDIADDLMLIYELKIDWAPIIPYIPVPNTPLSKEGSAGDIKIMHKVISILRIMLPNIDITAQQPSKDLSLGLGSFDGNKDALLAGANVLFVDLTPKEAKDNFLVTNNRALNDISKIKSIIEAAEMN